jgi:hypothetical protein
LRRGDGIKICTADVVTTSAHRNFRNCCYPGRGSHGGGAGGATKFLWLALSLLTMPPQAMPTTAPKKKTAPAKAGAAKKTSVAKPAKKSNFIPNFLKGKVVLAPDFFEAHERPKNWPSSK